jgi:hypothetical protein
VSDEKAPWRSVHSPVGFSQLFFGVREQPGCEVITLVNQRVREFERVAPGVRAQPPWLLSDPESNRFGTKTRAAMAESSQTLGNPGV